MSFMAASSADGKYAVATRWTLDGRYLMPLKICEDGDKDIFGNEICNGDSFGYVITDSPHRFSLADSNQDTYWGSTDATWSPGSIHSGAAYLRGTGSDMWFYFIEEGTSAWWRFKVPYDGTPTHKQDRSAPYAWGGTIEPVNTVVDGGGSYNGPDPWCINGTEDSCFLPVPSRHQ